MKLSRGVKFLILFGSGLCAVYLTWRPKTDSATAKSASTAVRPYTLDPAKSQYSQNYWPTFPRHKVFPYSVIPGGVADPKELKSIIKRDPEIARHLKDFNVEKARVVKLAKPWSAYVSYRRGNAIYWTRKRVCLAKGELVITDGNHTLRSRCGNDVSATPHEPTSPSEPPPGELDTPLPNMPFEAKVAPPPLSPPLPPGVLVPVFPPSPTPPLILPPPVIYPPGGPAPPPPTPPVPPLTTPEPATMLLFCVAGAGTLAWRVVMKRTGKPSNE